VTTTVAPFEAGRALGEGVLLGAYTFHGQKTDAPPKPVAAATVHWGGRGGTAFAEGLRVGAASARAQCFARDLGNQPASVATPTWLASQAAKSLRGSGVRCGARKRELENRGFGGLLGVARGSVEPPVFMEFEWRPRSYKKTLCLVGKGLTFDTGGISLKPAANMEEMKFDMCGGAAVIGAFAAIASLRPKVRVVGLVPSTENMPGGAAIKPGDVLTSYGGISIEVINTDAEGRLILADALGRAREIEPDFTVDLATLTGACVVALGHRAAASSAARGSRRLREAGDAHERLWPLPLWDEYLDVMKSAVADVKNLGRASAGR
jgi:leucyl aminopeptidase